MVSLLIIRRGADIVGQCDELCYDARNPTCVCKACEGANHGIGLEDAIANTRTLAAGRDQPGERIELADAVQNLSLFDLPSDGAADMTATSRDAEPPTDDRFTMGLVYDIAQVLEKHGYRAPQPTPDGDESARNLAYGTLLANLHRLVRDYEGVPDTAG